MATLVSPGVSVTVIDESNYAPTGPGTVPLVVLATQESKKNSAGSLANYTTKANAGKVFKISSQKELLNNYGIPVFPSDSSGNRLYGSELAEYGLYALHSTLGLTNGAYAIRADIDLAQLVGSSQRPTGNVVGGTLWLDTAISSWGVFEWDATAQTFNRQIPTVITNTAYISGGVPLTSIGSIGSYAVNATVINNPIYYKNYLNAWVLAGSAAWQQTVPSVIARNANVTSLVNGNSITINGTSVVLSGTTQVALKRQLNQQTTDADPVNPLITGVRADIVNGYFQLFVDYTSKSNGSVADGKINIQNGTGSILTALGITPAIYGGVSDLLGPHTNVPQWKTSDATPRPSGSLWIKTTNVNYGANLQTYAWNNTTLTWDLQSNPIYQNGYSALAALDPTQGGLGIALNTLYTQYDAGESSTVTFKTFVRGATGATTVVGTVANPTLTQYDEFSIRLSTTNSTVLSSAITVTLSGTTASSLVTDVLAAVGTAGYGDIFSASLTSTGNVQFQHLTGGEIILANVTNTPLTTIGITANNQYARQGNNNTLVISNWLVAGTGSQEYYKQSTAPVAAPDDQTLWYYETPLEVDIMINSNGWKGYHTVTSDARGYPLNTTDINGVIVSPTSPTLQSSGHALVYGDLWLDSSSSALENYPKLSRWQSVSGTPQWVPIDNSDTTTENGIIFADARWDTDGTTDPALDPLVSTATLLTSSYTDLDAPDHTLYPRGTLLFNTRRSSYNVKKFVMDHFTFANYPLAQLPATAATWVSASGKQSNNVPYMGRKAVRNVITSAMKHAVDNSTEIREEQRNFNLLVAPAYPELLSNLVTLNNDRRNTGFVLSDVPMGLSDDTTTVENYLTNSTQGTDNGEDALVTSDPYAAIFYPGAALASGLDGTGSVVVPMTHAALRMIIKSDQNSYPWFAPAGNQRGTIDNITKIGYVNRITGQFNSMGTTQGLRDLVYPLKANPVTVFPGTGILNYGNKTLAASATAMDRINVARLIAYIRYNLEVITKPFVFEPNDKITRNEAKQAVEQLMNDLIAKRGLYDYLVVCDETNNTNATIDRNELHIDIAIEPIKAVEFIYIPVRIKNTGEIAAGNIANALPVA